MNNTEALKNLFKNVDEKTLMEATQKARALAQNPRIKKAFSDSDISGLSGALNNMSENDKQRLLRELSSPKNAELLNAIKSNIG